MSASKNLNANWQCIEPYLLQFCNICIHCFFWRPLWPLTCACEQTCVHVMHHVCDGTCACLFFFALEVYFADMSQQFSTYATYECDSEQHA